MTLDAARIDLSRAFVEGMGYVALSRVRGLRYLILDGLNGMALKVSPVARQLDAHLRLRSEQALQDNNRYIEQWKISEKNGENARQMTDAQTIVADPVLVANLKEWRKKRAAEEHVPPYMVAHDKTLQAVAALKPRNASQLLDVPGFGKTKIDKYGEDLYKIVAQFID
jgi:superfamily II DNA helicase RecQ